MPHLLIDPARLPTLLWAPNLIGYVRVSCIHTARSCSDDILRSTISLPWNENRRSQLSFSPWFSLIRHPQPLCGHWFCLSFWISLMARVLRALKMCSQFGDILDHVTDHVSMAWLVWLTSSHPINLWINLVCNLPIPLGYMAITGHYFKHAASGNWVTRAVESGNYWNALSAMWCANTIIIPVIKLSYHEHGLDPPRQLT